MRRAVKLDETDLSLNMDYLLLLDRHEKTSVVNEALIEAIDKFSSNADLLYFKTSFLLKQGKYQQAYQCFELGLTMDFKGHEKVFLYYPNSKTNQNLMELIDLYRD